MNGLFNPCERVNVETRFNTAAAAGTALLGSAAGTACRCCWYWLAPDWQTKEQRKTSAKKSVTQKIFNFTEIFKTYEYPKKENEIASG